MNTESVSIYFPPTHLGMDSDTGGINAAFKH